MSSDLINLEMTKMYSHILKYLCIIGAIFGSGISVSGQNKFFPNDYDSDFILSSSDLMKINPTDLWLAIKALVPYIDDTNELFYGSDPNFISNNITVRNRNGWKNSDNTMPTFILDNNIVHFQRIKEMDINDVENVIIRLNPMGLSQYGIKGGNSIIEIRTQKLMKGNLSARYDMDLLFESADLSSYHMMNAKEKLEIEKSSSLYQNYPELLKEREDFADDKSTNWLKFPLQTAFAHKHRLSIYGGDRNVGYRLNIRYSPNREGVMKGSKKTVFGISNDIEYSKKWITITNSLKFDQINRHASKYGFFNFYAKLNPYYTNILPDPILGSGSFNEQINPNYEKTLSSFDKIKLYQIYENLKLHLDMGRGFSFNGQFAFIKDIEQEDIYISPLSAIYHYNSVEDNTGKYDILRNNRTSFEGSASISYDNSLNMSDFGVTIEVRPFSSKVTNETFGGVGIPSDKMSFINFTKTYTPNQTPIASRIYDRTLSSYVSGYYNYNKKYSLNASFTYDRSSLLAKNNRDAFFYGFNFLWKISNEGFFSSYIISNLSISGAIATSANIDFTSNMTEANIAYMTNGNYNFFLDNYPLIGSIIKSLPNKNLKPTTITNRNLTLNLIINSYALKLNYYNNSSRDLLVVEENPLATGFPMGINNKGKVNNTGFEYVLNGTILQNYRYHLDFFNYGNYNKYKIKTNDVITYGEDNSQYMNLKDPSLRGNFGFTFSHRNWSLNSLFNYSFGGEIYNYTLEEYVNNADIKHNVDKRYQKDKTVDLIEKNNEFSLSSIQISYSFNNQICRKLHTRQIYVSLTGNNLAYSGSTDRQRGIYYPDTRSYTFSLKALF